MALTQIEKKILRRIVVGKSDDEIDAIGASDALAKELIQEFSAQANSTFEQEIMMHDRQEAQLQQQLQMIRANRAARVRLNELTSQIIPITE